MIELPADRYHTPLRFTALGLWITAVGGVYLLGDLLWSLLVGPVSGAGILVLFVVALFGAQPLAGWAEKQLITRWPSGRAVQLEGGRLTLREKTGLAPFDLSQKINYWRWRFEIRSRRGGRVPNGHFCFAIRLVQGEAVASLYTFFSPEQSKGIHTRYPAYDLRPVASKAPSPLGGRDAVYLAAEHERWDVGAELDPADFEKLLTHLAAHVPDFVAPNS
jgi:hypothetical protein